MASASRRSRIRCRIWSWMVTSSAVVGSSARSSFGSEASAMAIITRCRIPPENWCGYSSSLRPASGMPTRSISSRDRARRPRPSRSVCARRFSSICTRTGRTGLSAVIGSWKIIEICPPRTPRNSASDMVSTSRPCHSTAPVTRPPAGSRRRSERSVTLLPDPLSPTRPSTSPGRTSKETPSTAQSACAPCPKVVVRSRTRRTGPLIAAPAGVRPARRPAARSRGR